MSGAPICVPGKVTRGCQCVACDRLRDDRLTFNQKRRRLSRRRDAARTMEGAALQHAADWRAYQATPQARIDDETDRARRAAADRASGHLPACRLTGCAPGCPRESST